MTPFSTESLTWLDNAFKMIVWIAGIVTGLALLGGWISGRELDHRRADDFDAMRAKADGAVRDAQQLRQKLAPRGISDDQRKRLLRGLGDSKGELEIVYPADAEAEVFANRIAKVISEAGWHVKLTGAMTFGPVFGFKIVGRDATSPSPLTESLRSAVQSAFGGTVVLQSDPRLPEGPLVLTVGIKPAE